MPVLFARDDKRRNRSTADTVEVGLLNNLGGGGIDAGERQLVELLNEAAGTRNIRVHRFMLPSIVRSPDTHERMQANYSDLRSLLKTRLDGLFVTGCEPRAAHLKEEAFWSDLVKVIDWADQNTHSTIWSCLSAHAAVLHLDGIERRRLPAKCSGVFAVERAGDHPLFAGAAGRLEVCHSRYNDLAEADLVAKGYEILTRSKMVGVDAFARRQRSLFVFLQGHPEYDGGALKREYRRDVMRFLAGTSETYPNLPANYFRPEVERELRAFEAQAKLRGDPALATVFPLNGGGLVGAGWSRDLASTLMRNWIATIQQSRAERLDANPPSKPLATVEMPGFGIPALVTP